MFGPTYFGLLYATEAAIEFYFPPPSDSVNNAEREYRMRTTQGHHERPLRLSAVCALTRPFLLPANYACAQNDDLRPPQSSADACTKLLLPYVNCWLVWRSRSAQRSWFSTEACVSTTCVLHFLAFVFEMLLLCCRWGAIYQVGVQRSHLRRRCPRAS